MVEAPVPGERFLAGQAYLENGYIKQGTPIGIHQGGAMDQPPTVAKVVSRFPKLWSSVVEGVSRREAGD